MTKLEAVIERLRALPADEQEYTALVFDEILDERDATALTPAQEAELAHRLNGPDDYASDEETEAFFARHGK